MSTDDQTAEQNDRPDRFLDRLDQSFFGRLGRWGAAQTDARATAADADLEASRANRRRLRYNTTVYIEAKAAVDDARVNLDREIAELRARYAADPAASLFAAAEDECELLIAHRNQVHSILASANALTVGDPPLTIPAR